MFYIFIASYMEAESYISYSDLSYGICCKESGYLKSNPVF